MEVERGWTIELRREDGGATVESIERELHDSPEFETAREESRVLKYLDPYGDLVLNWLQMKDLLLDLETVEDAIDNEEVVAAIRGVVNRALDDVHVYLWFYGD